jgi:phage terminase Nu1 subunit (DNA packaging protein)
MATVNVTRVAAFLNLTEQRVQQLAKEGILPRAARGLYDPIKCGLSYIRYLQRAIERKTDPLLEDGNSGERHERVRLLRANADLRESERAKMRSQLVAVRDVDKLTADLVRTTTAEIMAIPARLAPELVGETSRVMIQAKLEKAVKASLKKLAGHRPAPFEESAPLKT